MFNNFLYSLLVFFLFFNFCSAQIQNNSLFYSEINLNIKKPIALDKASLASIIYGNSKYGYFETKDFIFRNGQLKASLIPPGYQAPLDIYIKDSQNICQHIYTCMPVKSFEQIPLNIAPSGRARWKNCNKFPFSTPYIMLSGSIRPDKNNYSNTNQNCIYILNRYGEVSWLYVPEYSTKTKTSEVVVRKLSGGRYAFLVRLKNTANNTTAYLDIIDYKKGRFNLFDSKKQFPGYIFTHDFVPLNELGDKFFILSFKEHFRYSNRLCLLDTAKRSLQELWLDPQKSNSQNKFIKNQDPPSKPNSINYYPGLGSLVSYHSFLNDCYLILFNDKFEELWTLGEKNTTYLPKTPRDVFRGQHDAQLLPNGHILLFDNGRQHKNNSRILELALNPIDKTYTIFKEFFLDYPSFSKRHSSASQLYNDNILGFFTNTNDHSVLAEFDYETGKIVARMNSDVGGEYRAVPLDNIGTEKFIGYALPYRIKNK